MRQEDQLAQELLLNFQKGAESQGLVIRCKLQWNQFVAKHAKRKCDVSSFIYHHTDGHVEYLSYLCTSKNELIATIRSVNPTEVIQVSIEWLSGVSLESLYLTNETIDKAKRGLQKLDEHIIELYPLLANVERRVTWQEETAYYVIAERDRSCNETTYISKPELLVFDFCWDQCCVAQGTVNDVGQLASAIQSWVIDKQTPTKMQENYAFFKPNVLAKYYEEGRGIEGEFVQSWDDSEKQYKEYTAEVQQAYLDLIKEMRKRCFDQTLRAGLSMVRFTLSRARRHGLTSEDPCLKLVLHPSEKTMTASDHFGNETHFETLLYNDKLEQMLRELERQPIV
jgi:hypothetical protein